MSYPYFEVQGVEITDEKEFQQKVCGTCQFREVCENWELQTLKTLYSNVNEGTKEPLTSHSGKKKGVFRCASYTPETTRNAFVIYGSLGQPLVYIVKTETEDYSEEEMSKLMELFRGKDNAETLVAIKEVV